MNKNLPNNPKIISTNIIQCMAPATMHHSQSAITFYTEATEEEDYDGQQSMKWYNHDVKCRVRNISDHNCWSMDNDGPSTGYSVHMCCSDGHDLAGCCNSMYFRFSPCQFLSSTSSSVAPSHWTIPGIISFTWKTVHTCRKTIKVIVVNCTSCPIWSCAPRPF